MDHGGTDGIRIAHAKPAGSSPTNARRDAFRGRVRIAEQPLGAILALEHVELGDDRGIAQHLAQRGQVVLCVTADRE